MMKTTLQIKDERIEELEAEVERLRAIVDKLSKTADGVAVVFHRGGIAGIDGAWHPDFDTRAESWGYCNDLGYYVAWSFCRPNGDVAVIERRPIGDCYRTPKAAEAARTQIGAERG